MAKKKHVAPWLKYASMLVALLLIITGCLMLIHEIGHYSDAVAANQDAYLLNSVRYIDKNMTIQLETYRSELAYVLNQVGFVRLEEDYFATGNAEPLVQRMRTNLLAEDQFIACILAVRDGKIILSSTGHTDYTITTHDPELTIGTVVDGDGSLYLALPCVRGDVTYLALVDMAQYYSRMLHALPVSDDRLFFLESTAGHVIHEAADSVTTTHIDHINEDHADTAVFDALLRSEADASPLNVTYVYAPDGEKRHDARLAIIPVSQLTNGVFTIGMSVDYSAMTDPLYASMQQIIIYALLAMLGVGMLILIVVAVSMGSVRRDRELEALHQKNEEMAQLTERTLNLYHHQRLETIGTLTSSIAHEFGNLLTPIMGYSIMTMEALPPEYEDLADNLREIYDASCSAKTIIARLSDLSRKNTGASYVYVSPDQLVQRMMSVAQPSIPENVEVELALHAPDVQLHGNETQLSQMLLNLLLNACHAMHDKGGKLTVATTVENKLLRIRISDTGVGIKFEHLEKIFDPFFTTREAGKGTGLGLSISQQVAREHGGDIAVASTPGEGATFDVILPLSTPAG